MSLRNADGPNNRGNVSVPGRDSVMLPEVSLTDTLGVVEVATPRRYSKRPSDKFKFFVHFSFVWILLVYYRIYAEDGAIPSKAPAAPDDPFLGCIKARSVAPPHTAKAVKHRIAKMENIKDRTNTSLFLTPYSQSPMDDADRVTILNQTGPGSTPQEPLALVAKMSESERSALESEGRGGLASAAEIDTTPPKIRYRTSINVLLPFFLNHLDCWGKCTINFTLTIVICHRKSPLIQRSLPLVVSGLILLHRHIIPPPSNDAFREWKESQHLPTPIFLRTYQAMPHWKKTASQSFALIAQAWVRMSQWL